MSIVAWLINISLGLPYARPSHDLSLERQNDQTMLGRMLTSMVSVQVNVLTGLVVLSDSFRASAQAQRANLRGEGIRRPMCDC